MFEYFQIHYIQWDYKLHENLNYDKDKGENWLKTQVSGNFITYMRYRYLPVAYASIMSANFGSTIVVRDTWVTTSNGSDMLKESDSFAVVFVVFILF